MLRVKEILWKRHLHIDFNQFNLKYVLNKIFVKHFSYWQLEIFWVDMTSIRVWGKYEVVWWPGDGWRWSEVAVPRVWRERRQGPRPARTPHTIPVTVTTTHTGQLSLPRPEYGFLSQIEREGSKYQDESKINYWLKFEPKFEGEG